MAIMNIIPRSTSKTNIENITLENIPRTIIESAPKPRLIATMKRNMNPKNPARTGSPKIYNMKKSDNHATIVLSSNVTMVLPSRNSRMLPKSSRRKTIPRLYEPAKAYRKSDPKTVLSCLQLY